jgi:hypothetical protein
MDRGIPTEDSLAKMRSIGASYLVGTPKGRLTKLEQAFLGKPWAKVREGVQVKRLATEEDVYVLAHSDARVDKERGMRRKRLRRYIERLKALQGQSLTHDQLLMKLGAAKHDAGRAAGLVKVTWPKDASSTASLEFSLDRQRLRQVRRREGRYLLRTNLTAQQPETLWTFYIQLTEVEQAFKEIKHDLAIDGVGPQAGAGAGRDVSCIRPPRVAAARAGDLTQPTQTGPRTPQLQTLGAVSRNRRMRRSSSWNSEALTPSRNTGRCQAVPSRDRASATCSMAVATPTPSTATLEPLAPDSSGSSANSACRRLLVRGAAVSTCAVPISVSPHIASVMPAPMSQGASGGASWPDTATSPAAPTQMPISSGTWP